MHRPIKGGVGHNLPQEAPRAFAEAIIDVESLLIGGRQPSDYIQALKRTGLPSWRGATHGS